VPCVLLKDELVRELTYGSNFCYDYATSDHNFSIIQIQLQMASYTFTGYFYFIYSEEEEEEILLCQTDQHK